MRAPRNESVGTSGESYVKANFEELGWGAFDTAKHDLGTDLFLTPRDDRRHDLAVLLGAQVKTGTSFFKSPHKNPDGSVIGWWFKSDDEHFEYWLKHAVPHIIILHDQSSKKSYWQHITPETTIRLKGSSKILVPHDQIVCAKQNQKLREVALSQLPTPAWEGTAWTGAVDIKSSERIRYALLAPRLLAPNPNKPRDSGLESIEALASQVLIREELHHTLLRKEESFPIFSSQPSDLNLDTAAASSDWVWRATAALHSYLYDSDEKGLLDLQRVAVESSERVASVILTCMVYIDRGDPDSALKVLNVELKEHDDQSPIDHAWLQAQKARALLEIGEHEEAFDLALEAQQIRKQVPSDVTAGAIAGACATTIYYTLDRKRGDLSDTIKYYDNTSTWWRAELISSGLSKHLEESFNAWAGGNERDGWTGNVQRRLRAASLISSLAGDQNGWRAAQKQRGCYLLSSSTASDPPEKLAGALTVLRMAGSSDAVKEAAKHLVNKINPKIGAIAVETIHPSHSTRTTALADLEVLTACGDLLSEAQGNQLCKWAIETLKDPTEYLTRTRPLFFVSDKMIDLICAIIPSLEAKSIGMVIDYLLALPAQSDTDGSSYKLARLVQDIPHGAWTCQDKQRILERYHKDGHYLREAYLRIISTDAHTAQAEIEKRASEGDILIFEAINDVRVLSGAAAKGLFNQLEKLVFQKAEDARKGCYAYGFDAGEALTLLSVHHPNYARWPAIETYLQVSSAPPYYYAGTLRMLRSYGDKLPQDVKMLLRPCLKSLYHSAAQQGSFFGKEGVRDLASEALATISSQDKRHKLIKELLSRSSIFRASAAQIIGRFGHPAQQEILLSLSRDSDPAVKCAALNGLSRLTADEKLGTDAVAILTEALVFGAKDAALAIALPLQPHTNREDLSNLFAAMRDHPCASIRKLLH